MALKLLAGPYSMQDLSGNYCQFFEEPMWFDQFQALLGVVSKRVGTSGLIVPGQLVQLSGAVLARNTGLSARSSYHHDLTNHGIAESNTYLLGLFRRGVDPVSLVSTEAGEPSPLDLLRGAAVVPGEILFHTGSAIYGRALGTSTNTLKLSTPSIPAAAGGGRAWTPGPAPGQLFIGGGSNALLYDYVNNRLVGWQRKLGFVARWPIMYAKELGVWLVVTQTNIPVTHDQIWIYADEPEPTSLSAPIALSPVSEGAAPEFQVRLTGASGEPCVGYQVDWTVQLPAKQVTMQSATDESGYAEAVVSVPLGTQGLAFDLTAQVVV